MLQTLHFSDDVSKVVTEKLPFNDTSKYTMVLGYCLALAMQTFISTMYMFECFHL